MTAIEADLRARLHRVYVDGWPYWENPPDYMERKERTVLALRDKVAEYLNREATVQTTPKDINNYYDIECPLTSGLPPSRSELDYDQVEQGGQAEYFQLLISVVAPVVAGVWHRFCIRNNEPAHEMVDFLSDDWFRMHPEYETAALNIASAAEEQNLTVLGWDVTLLPADDNWPLSRFMPENPDLRHYLFKGYYDDWGGIVKPVRDL